MKPSSFWVTFGPLFVVNASVVFSFLVFIIISKNRPKTAEIEERHSSLILNKWIREYWMWFSAPIYKFFIKFKFTPNTISFLGTVIASFSALAFVYGHIALAGWLMVLGASFDFFDGQVARATNTESLAGSFFDSSLDRISEGVVLTGIAYLYRNSFIFWIVMLAYIGSMLTSYTKAKGETMGVEYAGGMMQRPERVAYLGAGAILAPVFAYITYPFLLKNFPNLTMPVFEGYVYCIPLFFVALFCNLTAVNRIVNIMKSLTKKEFDSKT